MKLGRIFERNAEAEPRDQAVRERESFLDVLAQELVRARRYQRPLSLLVFRLVGLETFGSRREAILDAAQALLKERVRECDHVHRLPSDELVVLLPETQREGATFVGERLRKTISSLRWKDWPELPLRAAVGLACFPESGATVEELVHRSDQGVFHALTHGCDRVYFVDSDPVRWTAPMVRPPARATR